MNTLSKQVCLPVLFVAGAFLSASASAAFNDFTVEEGVIDGTTANDFTADRIVGGYDEVANFTLSDATSGTFSVSILWTAGQYLDDELPVAGGSFLGGPGDTGYGMYAFFQGDGDFVINADGTTDFAFDAGGSFGLYIDEIDALTTYVAPATGAGLWTTSGTSGDDDELLATGALIDGAGTLDPTLSTCGTSGVINCGSFGATSSFLLTAFGSTYFTGPDPFYNLAFEAGQFNNFDVTDPTTQRINGSMDVVFSRVPEPSTLALIGLGLLGLSRVGKRNKV